jgi:hypothetical protein
LQHFETLKDASKSLMRGIDINNLQSPVSLERAYIPYTVNCTNNFVDLFSLRPSVPREIHMVRRLEVAQNRSRQIPILHRGVVVDMVMIGGKINRRATKPSLSISLVEKPSNRPLSFT